MWTYKYDKKEKTVKIYDSNDKFIASTEVNSEKEAKKEFKRILNEYGMKG